MKSFFGIIGGAIIGAGAMYLGDPVQGRRRRGLVRDELVHLGKVTTRTAHNATHDVSNRVKGLVKETTRIVRHEPVDDAKLGDRVRSAVGRVSSHPNVEVIVADGHLTLLGPVVDREEQAVLHAARTVRGVSGVTNRMKPYRRVA